MSTLLFVTSNPAKLLEARAILETPLQQVDLDLPEIQDLDLVAVVRDKAQRAFAVVGAAVLVEDTALGLDSLGGFPGPLVRWALAAAGPDALCRMATGCATRNATARCAAVAWDGKRHHIGLGTVAGSIVQHPRGRNGFGWDAVFAPEWGGGRTFAEMTPEEKNSRSHRTLAWRALRGALAGADCPPLSQF